MFSLPKLDYAYNALEPHIDELTMSIHHTKHHQAYIDNANKALAGTPLENKTVEELLTDLNAVPEDKRTIVRNHGGGHYNHSLYWKMMGPGKGGQPSGNLGDAISTKFGGFEKFQEQFTTTAMGRFGSGWGWLVSNKGQLELTSTQNQDTPLSEGKTPLLGLDMWEHSMYLRYQNRKAEYIKAWWNVVNWDYVAELFKKT
ncbi:superoxide dismutase [Candidatus Micrarchaeota archaeon]|nr:superoxide dismutase [Candidatus Micrarchaeota archaeon]